MARYDFLLSDEEFGDLTPGEFNALCKRRNIRIRYERYANALTAAAVYNCNRSDADSPVVTAFDFVRDDHDVEKREKLLKAKRFMKQSLALPLGTPREKFLEIRLKVIDDLKASGYANAEQIVNESFPSLMGG
jgi:hypothetical protein